MKKYVNGKTEINFNIVPVSEKYFSFIFTVISTFYYIFIKSSNFSGNKILGR
jgi:hypothetical protein